MGDSLLVGRINSVCEGTADLAQDVHWRDRPCPGVAVFEQGGSVSRLWVWVTARRSERHNRSIRLDSGSSTGV